MKRGQFGLAAFLALAVAATCYGQQAEAETGFGLQGTFSALGAASTELQQAPRLGSLGTGGFRLMLYPTLKISRHWTVAGAYQAVSRPYFYSGLDTQ
jgi:hypothetical protein